jgi:hypothetical protein
VAGSSAWGGEEGFQVGTDSDDAAEKSDKATMRNACLLQRKGRDSSNEEDETCRNKRRRRWVREVVEQKALAK